MRTIAFRSEKVGLDDLTKALETCPTPERVIFEFCLPSVAVLEHICTLDSLRALSFENNTIVGAEPGGESSLHFSEPLWEALMAFGTLERLVLRDFDLPQERLLRLEELRGLEALDLRGNSRVDAVVLESLRTLPALRSLWLSELDPGPQFWETLGQLTQLESLAVVDLAADVDVGLGDVQSLQGLGLRELKLGHLKRDDEVAVVEELVGWELRALFLDGLHDENETKLWSALEAMTLEALGIHMLGIDESTPQKLGALRSLHRLDLSSAYVEEPDFSFLSALPELRALQLKDLLWEEAPRWDVLLASLRGLRGLEVLSLAGNLDLKDKHLGHLKPLSSLKQLDLSMTEVSVQGVRRFEREFCDIQIVHTTLLPSWGGVLVGWLVELGGGLLMALLLYRGLGAVLPVSEWIGDTLFLCGSILLGTMLSKRLLTLSGLLVR